MIKRLSITVLHTMLSFVLTTIVVGIVFVIIKSSFHVEHGINGYNSPYYMIAFKDFIEFSCFIFMLNGHVLVLGSVFVYFAQGMKKKWILYPLFFSVISIAGYYFFALFMGVVLHKRDYSMFFGFIALGLFIISVILGVFTYWLEKKFFARFYISDNKVSA